MFVCVTTCIYGAYSGILCLDFVTCIVTSLFSGSFGWIDRSQGRLDGSIYVGQTTKGRRRGYGVYMVSQQCQLDTMTRSDDDGSTTAKYKIDTAVMSTIPVQLE